MSKLRQDCQNICKKRHQNDGKGGKQLTKMCVEACVEHGQQYKKQVLDKKLAYR